MQVKTTYKGTIELEKEPFASGGEGKIFCIKKPVNVPFCVKIYNEDKRSLREAKILYMVNNIPPNPISANEIICWPMDAVYYKQKFIGYVMPLAHKNSIELHDLCKNTFRASLSSVWKKKYNRESLKGQENLAKIASNLCLILNKIHKQKGYVFTDLKPQNVLVNHEGKISLVDCDSVQIDFKGNTPIGLRANPILTLEYSPPESNYMLQKKSNVPISWEYFSLGVIIYQLLIGVHPYSASFNKPYDEYNTLKSKINKGLFVFGNKQASLRNAFVAHERYRKLPKVLQEMFLITFDKANSMHDIRPSEEQWGKVLSDLIFRGVFKKQKVISIKPKKIRRNWFGNLISFLGF